MILEKDTIPEGMEVLTKAEIDHTYSVKEEVLKALNKKPNKKNFFDFRQLKKHTKGELWIDENGKVQFVGGHLVSELSKGISFIREDNLGNDMYTGIITCVYKGKKLTKKVSMFPYSWSFEDLKRKLKVELNKKLKSGYFSKTAKKQTTYNEVCITTLMLPHNSHKIPTTIVYRPRIINDNLLGIELTSVYPKEK